MRSARFLRSALSPLLGCSCALFAIALAGCEMFSAHSQGLDGSGKPLPQLSPASDAIEVEVVYVERPVGDRLLGPALWVDIDQILPIEPELQKDLEKNGFHIGVANSNLTEAMQELMRANGVQEVSGKRIYFRSGTEMQIQASPIYPECDMTIYPTHLSEVGEKKEYRTAQCLFRVTAHRVQEGWAQLEFLPEIHHGTERPRANPGTQDWSMINSQIKEPLYAQRFPLRLSVGEFAMVTARDNMPGTVGHRFFCGPEGDDGIQRLLLIRLSRVGNPDAPSAK